MPYMLLLANKNSLVLCRRVAGVRSTPIPAESPDNHSLPLQRWNVGDLDISRFGSDISALLLNQRLYIQHTHQSDRFLPLHLFHPKPLPACYALATMSEVAANRRIVNPQWFPFGLYNVRGPPTEEAFRLLHGKDQTRESAEFPQTVPHRKVRSVPDGITPSPPCANGSETRISEQRVAGDTVERPIEGFRRLLICIVVFPQSVDDPPTSVRRIVRIHVTITGLLVRRKCPVQVQRLATLSPRPEGEGVDSSGSGAVIVCVFPSHGQNLLSKYACRSSVSREYRNR